MTALLILSLLFGLVSGTSPCFELGFKEPVDVVKPYAPVGQYRGHWGLDIAASEGSEVVALGDGVVTFAGAVAGRLSVTVNHGGLVRTSYSYLAEITTSVGREVRRGAPLGVSGLHDDAAAIHVSLRLGTRYVDPMWLGRCSIAPQPGLWLLSSVRSVS